MKPVSYEHLKQQAAQAALSFIQEEMVIGVGSGSTVNYFIEALSSKKALIEGCVASSNVTAEKLKAHGFALLDLNGVDNIPLYVDGADEINPHLQMIKGGGGALTREKIIAAASQQFICMADQSKSVDLLGQFPLAIEVIPMARSYVARQIVKLGGDPVYRQGFVTDNGNLILDVYSLNFSQPLSLEQQLNQITGVVCHGLFAARRADVLLLAMEDGVRTLRHE